MSQLFPMNFTEYQSLASKNKTNLEHNNLSKKIFKANNATKCKQQIEDKLSEIKQYWINTDQLSVANFLQLSTLPLSLNIPSKEKTRLQVEDLIDKVIEKDLAQLKNFDSTTLRKIKKILVMTADSDKVSYTSLAKNLENISKETIIKIFNSLQEAEFLLKSAPLGSTYKKVRKQSRFHFMSPALRFTLLTTLHGDNTYQKFKGKLLEDIAALYLTKLIRRKTLTKPLMYDAASGGADFVVNYNLDEQIVLEIGFNKSSTKQIKQTMDKIEEKAKFGILVTDNKIDHLVFFQAEDGIRDSTT
jgi:predicted AAA+ superfamily ATPase